MTQRERDAESVSTSMMLLRARHIPRPRFKVTGVREAAELEGGITSLRDGKTDILYVPSGAQLPFLHTSYPELHWLNFNHSGATCGNFYVLKDREDQGDMFAFTERIQIVPPVPEIVAKIVRGLPA